MSRPVLLDLFCGQGGAAQGYANAGFEVAGVDLTNQSRYPFEFHADDALGYLRWSMKTGFIERFSAIHASPPCQAYSITKHTHKVQHPDLLEPTRQLLKATGLPYIIENVPGAVMPGATTLCGSTLCARTKDDDGTELFLKRHRQFESNIRLTPPMWPWCRCSEFKSRGMKIGGVYGGGSTDRHHAENVRHGGYTPCRRAQEKLMGIDWMTRAGLNQAIPPVYAEFIGRQLMDYLTASTKESE